MMIIRLCIIVMGLSPLLLAASSSSSSNYRRRVYTVLAAQDQGIPEASAAKHHRLSPSLQNRVVIQQLYANALLARQHTRRLNLRRALTNIPLLRQNDPTLMGLLREPLTYLSSLELSRLASVSRMFAATAKSAERTEEAWRSRVFDLMMNDSENPCPQLVRTLMGYRYPIATMGSIAESYWREPEYMRLYRRESTRQIFSDWYCSSDTNFSRINSQNPAGLFLPVGLLLTYGIPSHVLHLLTGKQEVVPSSAIPPLWKDALAAAVNEQSPTLYARLRRQKNMAWAEAILQTYAKRTQPSSSYADTASLFSSLAQLEATSASSNNPLIKHAAIMHRMELIHLGIVHGLFKNFTDWSLVKKVMDSLEMSFASGYMESWFAQPAAHIRLAIAKNIYTNMTKEELCTYIEPNPPALTTIYGRFSSFGEQRELVAKIDELESRFADRLSIHDYFLIAKACGELGPTLRNVKAKPAIQKFTEQALQAPIEDLEAIIEKVKAIRPHLRDGVKALWRKALLHIEAHINNHTSPSRPSANTTPPPLASQPASISNYQEEPDSSMGIGTYIPSWDIRSSTLSSSAEDTVSRLPIFDFDTLNEDTSHIPAKYFKKF